MMIIFSEILAISGQRSGHRKRQKRVSSSVQTLLQVLFRLFVFWKKPLLGDGKGCSFFLYGKITETRWDSAAVLIPKKKLARDALP
jgi:hypothetical protein